MTKMYIVSIQEIALPILETCKRGDNIYIYICVGFKFDSLSTQTKVPIFSIIKKFANNGRMLYFKKTGYILVIYLSMFLICW